MRRWRRTRRNQPCPCGKTKKYKHCCWGRVPWEEILAKQDSTDLARHLSARGKNLLFLNLIGGALQLDRLRVGNLQEFKSAFTPSAVRAVFDAVLTVWPDGDGLERVLRDESDATSGLYVGRYDPQLILRGITRHSLYSERVLLVDPFPYPTGVRDEFNPLSKPELYRSTALRWVWLWLRLAPWIEADLVHFVRTPGDFDPALEFEANRITRDRYERHPELVELLKRQVGEETVFLDSYKRQILLGFSDDHYREVARRQNPELSETQIEAAIRHIQKLRERDPLILEPTSRQGDSEILQMSSGASYEMGKRTADISGSHLITDIEPRWAEIRLAREEEGVEHELWTPFAKTFSGVPFRYLEDVPLDVALRLRKEGRLADLRDCLGKAWRGCREGNEFAESNVENLTIELKHRIREAEAEWHGIRTTIIKKVVGGIGAGATAIASGVAEWLPAGIATAGIVVSNVAEMRGRRKSYIKRHPASFLLSMSKRRAS